MASKVMDAAARKALLLDVGAKLAAKVGAKNVTRRAVAQAGKVSEALVAHYFGGKEEAQKLYAKQAKKLGLAMPDKDKEEKIGKKMRAHGPRKPAPPRKRSAREVEAIKRKTAAITKSNKAVAKKLPKGAKSVTRKAVVKTIDAKTLKVVKPAISAKGVADVAKQLGIKSEAKVPATKALPGPGENKATRKIAPKPAPAGAVTGPVIPALPSSSNTGA